MDETSTTTATAAAAVARSVLVTVSPVNLEAVKGKLLRVSKVSTLAQDTAQDTTYVDLPSQGAIDNVSAVEDLPALSPTERKGQLHFYETVVKTSFSRNDIIELEPVIVAGEVIRELNRELQRLEAQDQARKGSRIPSHQPEAFFVTDMTSTPAESMSLELKAKWLAQSPDAPSNARSCRTCALKAMRKKAGTGQGFCPLNLISGDAQKVRPIVESLVRSNPFEQDTKRLYAKSEDIQSHVLDQLTAFFCRSGHGHDLLSHLRDLQLKSDAVGVLAVQQSGKGAESDDVRSLCRAMTFRDCSLFLRIFWDGRPIEARFGDLDFKKAMKLDSWAKTERSLIDGGWYAGKDQGSDCLLALK